MKASLFTAKLDSNRAVFYITVAAWFAILLVYYCLQSYPARDLLDTDAFTRLVRVEQLALDHNWYNSVIPRSNAPYGETLHWTRPLDLLLLLGAAMLKPFLGFRQALYWWGIVISPIIGAFSLAVISWAAKPVLDGVKRRLVWLLFLGQFLLVSVYHFGRPDHHSLLSLLFIGLLGCLLRLAEPGPNRRMAIWAGLLASLAIWVSVEALTTVVLIFVVLTLLCILQDEGYCRKLSDFAGTLLFSSVLFLLVEYPSAALLHFQYDRISIVHVLIFALATTSVGLLGRFGQNRPAGRFGAASAIAAADGVLLYLTIPAFFKGPFSQINPDIMPIWLKWVVEVQPLLSDSTTTISVVIGSMLLALGSITYQLLAKTSPYRIEHLMTFLIGLLIFIPLSFYQIRWVYYCAVILLIPLAMTLGGILEKLSGIKSISLRVLARAGAIVVFLFGFLVLGLVLDRSDMPYSSPDARPDTRALCSWLNDCSNGLPASAIICAYMDYGPEILYRTPHQVIATPYHRNDAGILFNHQVMTAANSEDALRFISQRPVDLVILTPQSSEKVVYDAGNNPDIFYNELLHGQIPEWLEVVPTPPGVSQWFLIFKVID